VKEKNRYSRQNLSLPQRHICLLLGYLTSLLITQRQI